MLKRFLPGLRWYEDYRPGDLKADLISGLTVAFILIPQGMAYAAVAGLPPELGLYACIFPPLIYALLGTSNKISVGPVALDSILILSGLSLLAEPGTAHYRELAIALTLCVGLIQVAFGYIKLGFVANFLSYPVILGYTAGAAVVIMCSQLEGLLGVTVDAESAPEVVYQALINMSQWHMFTAALGLGGIALMIAAKRVAPKWPTPLILLSAGMLASGLWSFADFEVDVIDRIPSGIPTPRLPQLGTGALIEVLPVAFTVAIMGYIGGISICKALESPRDRVALNPNQELIAIGFANLVGALFRAFPVSASFSRSAAFRASGAVTQLSAVVSAAVLLIALLALAPVFSDYPLPKTLLASIIIVSVAGLFDYQGMKTICRESPREAPVLFLTLIVTVLVGIQQGLLLGVLASLFMVIYKTARPHIAELGVIDEGSALYRNVSRFQDASVRDDVLILRFDAPLYFANKDYFADCVRARVKERDPQKLRFVVCNLESVNGIDYSAIVMLQNLLEKLQTQNVRLIFTNAIGPVRDAIKRTSLAAVMTEASMFATIKDAIDYIDCGRNAHAHESLQTNG